jgi:hypothetical protein
MRVAVEDEHLTSHSRVIGRDMLVALVRCFPRSHRRDLGCAQGKLRAPHTALEVFKSAASPSSCFPTHAAMKLRHGWGTRHSRRRVSVAFSLLGSQRILDSEGSRFAAFSYAAG